MKEILKNLKNNRSYKITAKMLKYGGEELVMNLQKLSLITPNCANMYFEQLL